MVSYGTRLHNLRSIHGILAERLPLSPARAPRVLPEPLLARGGRLMRHKLKQTFDRVRKRLRLIYDRMYEVYYMVKPVA